MNIGYSIKRLNDVVRALLMQRKQNRLISGTRQDLQDYQQQNLSALVAYSVRNSPFYRELYGNIQSDKFLLTDLPITNKSMMMDNFDQFVTDPRLKLTELKQHIRTLTTDEYYLGEYRVTATSGSSGLKGIFVSSRKEWSTALTAYLRCGSYMGLTPRLPKQRKISTIGADSPIHVSYRMAISSDIGLMKTQRLDATLGIERQCAALNSFQPEFLSAYPSIASLFAREQLEGRLSINPQVISTFGEVCTGEMKRNIQEAWRVEPFNSYGMTEAGIVLGSDCSCHQGIHVFEDLFILEVVDQQNRPVPDGTPGHKLLITNLFNFTQPIIRYEISDLITLSPEPCPCGRPFRLVSRIDGRSDDIIYLDNQRGGKLPVHPVHFYTAMGTFQEIKLYQVIHGDNGLQIKIVVRESASGQEVAAKLKQRLKSSLEALGAQPPKIVVEITDRFDRDPRLMGKMKLVTSLSGSSSLR